MRFSAIFHSSPPLRRATPPEAERMRGDETGDTVAPVQSAQQQRPPQAPAQELPDDLDARVRLIGEWQLGEG